MNIIAMIARLLHPFLEQSLIKRVRRNHALEHATIHMLNRQRYLLSGRASAGGFAIYGDVPTEKVEAAAKDAIRRLKQGQAELALHPNCGTNLVTSAVITTSIAAVGFTGSKRKDIGDRFPLVMLFMMAAALYSQPIGMEVQKYITTTSDLGALEFVAVKRSEMQLPFQAKKLIVHTILTHKG